MTQRKQRGRSRAMDTPDQRQLQPVAAAPPPGQLTPIAKTEAILAGQRARGGIARALAGRIDPDQFIGVALTLLKDPTSKLHQCTTISVLSAIIQGAQMGLSFQRFLGEVWLIPRRNKHTRQMEANCQLGYKGALKLISRSPVLGAVRCGVFCENDEYDYMDGSAPFLRHKIPLTEPRGPVQGAWALTEYRAGGFVFVPVPLAELRAAQKMGGPVWRAHYEAMCRKTALLRLGNLVPLDDRDKAAVAQDALGEATGESAVDNDLVDIIGGVEDPEPAPGPTLDSLADDHDREKAPPSEEGA